MKDRRAWSLLTLAVVVAVLALSSAAPAVGRHNFAMLRVSPEHGVPGEEVSVSGFSYPVNAKVSIRFNALDGPVLAELEPNPNQDVAGTLRIPADTPPGRYILYAVQYDNAGKINRIPGRAAIPLALPEERSPARRPASSSRLGLRTW